MSSPFRGLSSTPPLPPPLPAISSAQPALGQFCQGHDVRQVQSAAQKLKLCVKKNVKKIKTYIFSKVDDGWGHGYYLVEALCLTKSSFSLLSMLIFWLSFYKMHHRKNCPNFKSSPNKKYFCWDNKTWLEPVPETYKHTEKISG